MPTRLVDGETRGVGTDGAIIRCSNCAVELLVSGGVQEGAEAPAKVPNKGRPRRKSCQGTVQPGPICGAARPNRGGRAPGAVRARPGPSRRRAGGNPSS